MRFWPALIVEWSEVSRGGEEAGEPGEVLWAVLDRFAPSAVHELESAWKVFFDTGRSRDEAAAALAALGTLFRATSLDVEDEDWARRSQAALGAVTVGRLVISPPWAAAENPGAIVILPSMGFGSGHHATTRLCLQLLQETPVEGRRVVDVGTGSGVLAIAACRLGAVRVDGLDVDQDALGSARENVALNGLEDLVNLHLGDFRSTSLQGDIVTANLTSAAFVAGASELVTMVAGSGSLICSGFLEADEAAVTSALGAGLGGRASVARVVEDGWVAVRFDRS